MKNTKINLNFVVLIFNSKRYEKKYFIYNQYYIGIYGFK
jgi:hypothetical protein